MRKNNKTKNRCTSGKSCVGRLRITVSRGKDIWLGDQDSPALIWSFNHSKNVSFILFSFCCTKKIPIKQVGTITYGIAAHIAHSLESKVSYRLQALSASWQHDTGTLPSSVKMLVLILIKSSDLPNFNICWITRWDMLCTMNICSMLYH